MRAIVLFGMMGAGKSSVARLVADRLGRELVDTDAAVEAAAGRTVSQIFDHEGEPAFRRREREAVAAAARGRD
ncbi:MAG TPA: shikimate kinase, partial [Nitriliruptorales bacterium]|nr:shikimate kinase [Nitriliruptorales bacterium]